MNYGAAYDFIVGRMTRELPEHYYYHGLTHTLDVLDSIQMLASGEKISDNETLIILKTAAVYHDCGFLEKYVDNEPVAARIAAETLPQFGYSPEQIKTIERVILTTSLKAEPVDLLENIMKDADFDYLGRDDYSPISMKLKREWEHYGMKKTLKEWYELQLVFLTTHTFYSQTAKKLRDPLKQKHIADIKNLLGK